MANPYPMQQQQPMMPMGTGQGPVQTPGVPAMPGPRVMRRGTSKAVPVVVSAGLAIGVFCGLLFGLGVEHTEAVASTTVTTAETPKKKDTEVAAPFQPETKKNVDVPSLAPQVLNKDGTTTPAKAVDAGSGSGSGSGAKPAEPPKPLKINGTLKVEIEPADAAKVAKLTIDTKEIEGASYELDMTEDVKAATKDLKPDAKKPEVKKEIKVLVKAAGFRDFIGKVDVVAERDTTFKVTMQKKSSAPVGGGLPRPPPGGYVKPNNPPPSGAQKCKKPPCGLIDI